MYGLDLKNKQFFIQASKVSVGGKISEAKADKIKNMPARVNRENTADSDHPNALVVNCVLASTYFNQNDHVFLPTELWAARGTGKFQLADWEHDRDIIIGCISDTYYADQDGNVLGEDAEVTDETSFDVFSEIVVWEHVFEDYASKIKESHDDDKMFVSMECKFEDYDFAIEDASGNIKIIENNEGTAFLVNNLKITGGTGKYHGQRLGIAFRDISFVGVGFVGNPANERSVVTEVEGSKTELEELLEKKAALIEEIEKITEEAATDTNKKAIMDALETELGYMDVKIAATENCNSSKSKKEPTEEEINDINAGNVAASVLFEKKCEKNKDFLDIEEKTGVSSNCTASDLGDSIEEGVENMDQDKELEVAKADLESAVKRADEAEAKAEALLAEAKEVRNYSNKGTEENEYSYMATDFDGNEVMVTSNTVYTYDSVTKVTEELVAAITSAKEEAAEVAKKLEEVEAAKKEMEVALAQIELEKMQAERKSIVAGLDVEIDEEKLFAMSDEVFEAMVEFAPKKVVEEVAEVVVEKTEEEEEEAVAEKATEELEEEVVADKNDEDEQEDEELVEESASALVGFAKLMS